MKHLRRAAMTLLAFVFLCIGTVCFADVTHERILFISSYTYDWSSVPRQLEGLHSVLDGEASLETVFMNTKRLPTSIAEENALALVQTYIAQNGAYDAVIVGDDAALDFAEDYREQLFDGVPIIFEGINSVSAAEKAKESGYYAGVVERFPIEETVTLAAGLYPDAVNVVAISDATESGHGSLSQFYACEGHFPGLHFSDINASALTNEQLLEKVAAYDDSTVLIYLMRTNDKNGNVYSLEESCYALSQAANIPIFKADEYGVGDGLIGGAAISARDGGVLAAQMALEVVRGTVTLAEEPLQSMPVFYLFDYDVLKRFDIKTALLPANCTIINKPVNFFEEHAQLSIIILSVLVLGAMLIVFLSVRGHRNARFAKRLRAEQSSLTTAINHSRMTYAEYDLETSTMHFGEKAQRVHGLPATVENIPQGLFDTGRISPASYDAFDELVASIRSGNDSAMAQLQVYNSARRVFTWYRVLFTLIKSEDGTVLKAVCTASDITDEKQAEKRYEQALAYRGVLEQSTLASAHLNLTKNAVISTDKNESCTFGRFDKTTADDFLRECCEYINADGENKQMSDILSRTALVTAFSNGSVQNSAMYLHKGVDRVYMWRRITSSVIRNPGTRDIEVYLYLTNITDEVLRGRAYEKAISHDVDFVSYLEFGTNIVHCIYQRTEGGCMPPESGDFDMTNAEYIEKYVAPEDIPRAQQYFRRSALVQALVMNPVYTFTLHILDGENGAPRLKLFEISYLDEDKEAIVFIRKNSN